jgi:ABC-2 type transport system ATP-binding protein
MPPSVRAVELTRRFGDFVAVDRVSFEIEPGQIWGFLGPNGAGKSTTIRMLCGILDPSSGRAEILGYDVTADPEAVKQRIGYMSQRSTLWNDLTVDEHLRFYAGLFDAGRAEREARVARWRDRLGLTSRRHVLAAQLPGGFRQRLALACTLLHHPEVLFLDEPTAGVDPVSRREFWDIIVELADEGSTVMVTTHYLDEAEHCNELAFIYAGRIIAAGSPNALKHGPGIGFTVEVLADRVVDVLIAAQDMPFVRGASLFGASLHVTLDGEERLPELRGAFDRAGLALRSVEPIVPTLEDVFAALVANLEAGSPR